MSAMYAYVYTPAVIVWGKVVVPIQTREFELKWPTNPKPSKAADSQARPDRV